MANINNASVIFVVDSRNGAVARASVRPLSGKAHVTSLTSEGINAEVLSLAMIAKTIEDLMKYGVPQGGAMIIAADRPLRRVFEIRKTFNHLAADVKADQEEATKAVECTVVKPWMIQQNSPLVDALHDLVGLEVAWLEAYEQDRTKYDISFMKSYQLNSWELDGAACTEAGVKNGDKITFANGKTENGITSPDWNRIHGEFTVHTSTHHEGDNEVTRYFVDRFQSGRVKMAKALYAETAKKLPHDAEKLEVVDDNEAF
jgi:hypothetical protein